MVSDFHHNYFNKNWWAWLQRNAYKFNGVLMAGDVLDERCPETVSNQIQITSDFLRWLPIPPRPNCFFGMATGNHDISEVVTDLGKYYWYQRLTEECPHLLGHGLHSIPSRLTNGRYSSPGWSLDIVDFLEWDHGPESWGPCSILLTHVGPSCPTSWAHGISNGCDLLRDQVLAGDSSLVICHGHEHRPAAHFARLGRSLVCNPGVNGDPNSASPNHIVIDTTEGTCAFYSNGRKSETAQIYQKSPQM